MADVDVKLSERAGSEATCVFCRAPLDAVRASCPGCGVGLHEACRDELSKCPTLGCGHVWERRAPLTTFAPLLQSGGGRGRDERRARQMLWFLLLALPLAVAAPFLFKAVRGRLEAAAAARAFVSTPSPTDRRWESLRPTAEALAATPLRVDRDQRAVWSAGRVVRLESYRGVDATEIDLFHALSVSGGGLDVRVEEARRLFASLRLRLLAARDGSNPWSSQVEGAAARVRVTFTRVQTGASRSVDKDVLEATIRRLPQEATSDTIDLRVTVKNGARELSWNETWPRVLDRSLLEADPGSGADGLSLTSEDDGRPVPVRATLEHEVTPYLRHRVELERLEWLPGP